MKIGDREIGMEHPPYVIAEISCNHGGVIERAYELIDAAASAGADAVKFQCYSPHSMTIDSDRPEFVIKDGPWKGQRLYDLYRKTQTPTWWFSRIKERAERAGIHWFASVFDRQGVDLMVQLGAPAIKIASFEITDIPLIRYASATGIPLIISTGMASEEDIWDALDALAPHGASAHAILHCVSGYPTPVEQADLLRLNLLDHEFHNYEVGISDHSVGPYVPIAATALGISIIEKHFKLFWHPDSEDAAFSLDELDFAEMVTHVKKTWAAIQPSTRESEEPQVGLRRSLYAVTDIAAGDRLTDDNIRSIRPGGGLAPKYLDSVLGNVAMRDIERGEPLQWDMVDLSWKTSKTAKAGE